MNLLLLLSALLSAFTGVGGSVRGAEPAAAVAAQVAPRAAVSSATARAQRPQAVVPSRITQGWGRVVLAAAPRAAAPMFLMRRRE